MNLMFSLFNSLTNELEKEIDRKLFSIRQTPLYEKYNIDLNRTIHTTHAAKLLGIASYSVAEYCRNGRIKAKKIEGKWNVNLQSVLEYRQNNQALYNYIEEEKKPKIIDLIKESIYLGEFNINHERKNCKVGKITETRQCVYFIVQFLNGKIDFSENNAVIQKVGKADGEYGLQGRMSGYSCNNVKKSDTYLTKMYNVYKEQLNGETLHLFYIPFEPIITDIPGNFTVEVSRAREAEKMYAYYARVQGHPLLLSSYD
jgi:hypothetical protein